MSRLSLRELEQEVREAAPEPSPELLAKLLEEAPLVVPRPGADLAPAPAPPRSRAFSSWRLAASVAVLIAGGILSWRVARDAPPLPEPVDATRFEATVRPPAHDREAPVQPTEIPPVPSQPEPLARHPSPFATVGGAPARRSAPDGPGAVLVNVVDEAGVALPGVTVTLGGNGSPRVAVTDGSGHASFPDLPSGAYRVGAHLEGFSRLELDVAARAGRSLRLDVTLPSAVEDVITVTAESPLLDERRISTAATVSQTELERAPSSRDAWALLQGTPGVLSDRINVGGNEAGQQSGYTGTGRFTDGFDAIQLDGRTTPSTGGDAEPNDAPYGDVFYRGYGVNPFLDTEDDALSTFGLDVDTGSYNIVRRYLADRHLPPPEAVRLEELVNAFDYGDPAPRRGDFALHAEGAPSPWGPGERYYLLRLAVTAREVAAGERRPADLVFVVDVSGSMAREDRLGLVKESLRLLLGELTEKDRVALVVYGSRGEVRLPFTTDKAAIGAAIDRLAPDGSTNAEEGIALGYDLALREGRREAMRRIVLCSDGVANVGATGPESILARIGAAATEGVELTTVGFGMGNYNDTLMEQLANQGNGRYAYVDQLDEARRIFVENLTGTLQTVAAEARAQVEFDPRMVSRWRLVGYENRDIADERFRDDTVDAGEVGAGHSVTALYEIKLAPGAARMREAQLGTLRLRWRPAEGAAFEETELRLRRSDLAESWAAGSHAFKLATVVARFAETLRGSFWARDADLDGLTADARRLASGSDDPRVTELAELVARAADLRRGKADATKDAAKDEP
jgi:Ca-activated chloride channel family protein